MTISPHGPEVDCVIPPINESLGSGIFFVDEEWLDQQLPLMKEFRQAVDEYHESDGVPSEIQDSIDQSGIFIEGYHTRSMVRRKEVRDAESIGMNVIYALSRELAQTDRSSRHTLAEERLKPHFRDDIIGRGTCSSFALEAIKLSDLHSVIKEKSGTFVNEMREKITDSTTETYMLFKVLCSPNILHVSEGEFSPGFYAMAMLRVAGVGSKDDQLFKELNVRFSNGEFDELIAKDIFANELKGVSTGESSETFSKIVKLVQAVSEKTLPEIVNFLASNSDLWPSDISRLVAGNKADLAKILNTNTDFVDMILEENMITRGENEIQKNIFDRSMEEYKVICQRIASIATGKTPFTKAQIMRARLGADTHATTTIPETTTSTPTKIDAEPYKLIFITQAGENIHEQTDKFIDSILPQVYKERRRTDANFEEDLENIFKFLRNINPSNGQVRGVKKYKAGSTKRGDQEYAIFGLKPTDAPGLSTKTSEAKNLRVLFGFSDDKEKKELVVFGVAKRDQVKALERNLGVSSSAK